MAALGDIYFKKEDLEKLLKGVNAKGLKGVSIVFSINNETNQWGQNVSSYVSQTKEEQQAKKDRFYTGNGRVFWTDGNIKIADKIDRGTPKASDSDDLPW
jgi:hypothetical protein